MEASSLRRRVCVERKRRRSSFVSQLLIAFGRSFMP